MIILILYLFLKDFFIEYLIQFKFINSPTQIKHYYFDNKFDLNFYQHEISKVFIHNKYQIYKLYYLNQFRQQISIFSKIYVFERNSHYSVFWELNQVLLFPYSTKIILSTKYRDYQIYNSIIDYHFNLVGRSRWNLKQSLYFQNGINSNLKSFSKLPIIWRYFKPLTGRLQPFANHNYYPPTGQVCQKQLLYLKFKISGILFPRVGLFFTNFNNSLNYKNRLITELIFIKFRLNHYRFSKTMPGYQMYTSIYQNNFLQKINWSYTIKKVIKQNFIYLKNILINLIDEFFFFIPFSWVGFLILLNYIYILSIYLITSFFFIFPFFIPFFWFFSILIIYFICLIFPFLNNLTKFIFINKINIINKNNNNNLIKQNILKSQFLIKTKIIFYKNNFFKPIIKNFIFYFEFLQDQFKNKF
jgi:hypothetical protein